MKRTRDKRSAILDAALELFAERGFNGSPTVLIAKRAGVAHGTVFLYFKTKDDLIRELFQQIRADINDIAINNEEGIAIKDRLLLACSKMLRYFLDNSNQFKFVMQYYFSPFFDTEARLADKNERFRTLLFHAREQRVIKNLPLLVLEAISFGPILTIAAAQACRGKPVDDELIEQTILTCWDGLKLENHPVDLTKVDDGPGSQ